MYAHVKGRTQAMKTDHTYILIFHTDPGHGWLEVPVKEVRNSGVPISQCSYIKGDKAYLEEDCDAPAYLNYLDEKHIAYIIDRDVHVNHDHPIRNYNNWPEEWTATHEEVMKYSKKRVYQND